METTPEQLAAVLDAARKLRIAVRQGQNVSLLDVFDRNENVLLSIVSDQATPDPFENFRRIHFLGGVGHTFMRVTTLAV